MKIFRTPFVDIHRLYVAKVERKGRSAAEVDEAICWLTGYSPDDLATHLKAGTTVEDFLTGATLPAEVSLITGSVCGVKVQEIEDPLMRRIRYLDKLIDEIARGRPMTKVLRQPV